MTNLNNETTMTTTAAEYVEMIERNIPTVTEYDNEEFTFDDSDLFS